MPNFTHRSSPSRASFYAIFGDGVKYPNSRHFSESRQEVANQFVFYELNQVGILSIFWEIWVAFGAYFAQCSSEIRAGSRYPLIDNGNFTTHRRHLRDIWRRSGFVLRPDNAPREMPDCPSGACESDVAIAFYKIGVSDRPQHVSWPALSRD